MSLSLIPSREASIWCNDPDGVQRAGYGRALDFGSSKVPYYEGVRRLLWLIPGVVLIGGFRLHGFDVGGVKPALPSIGGPPGPGCGTGTTATWVSVVSSKPLPFTAAEARARLARDLRGTSYRKRNGDKRSGYVRRLNGGGSISIFVREDASDGACTLCCSVQAPRLTWYGMRVPSP
ncbi:MAG: hypothetical protein HONBIEJF_00950 [Fimbriimonadaceae bacterium]|nr:hypothetical protein [Fimbriimonadaceae bacterium]